MIPLVLLLTQADARPLPFAANRSRPPAVRTGRRLASQLLPNPSRYLVWVPSASRLIVFRGDSRRGWYGPAGRARTDQFVVNGPGCRRHMSGLEPLGHGGTARFSERSGQGRGGSQPPQLVGQTHGIESGHRRPPPVADTSSAKPPWSGKTTGVPAARDSAPEAPCVPGRLSAGRRHRAPEGMQSSPLGPVHPHNGSFQRALCGSRNSEPRPGRTVPAGRDNPPRRVSAAADRAFARGSQRPPPGRAAPFRHRSSPDSRW